MIALLLLITLSVMSQVSLNPQYPYPYATFNPYRPPQTQIIEGSYSFIDPSGIKRTVKYTNGPDGFKPVLDPEPPKDANATTPADGNSTTVAPPDKKEIKYVPVPVYPPSSSSQYYPYPRYPYQNFYGK